MFQKIIYLDIVLKLNKEKMHLRELAKSLKLNPATLMRRINELVEMNILDFEIKGKNKEFFLKNNIESYNYKLMAERYKLNKIMSKYPKLKPIIRQLKEKTKNELIVLFGSYTKEKANNNSDIDIYIETKNSKLKKELNLINSKLSIKIGTIQKYSDLSREIVLNHVIIQNPERFYELLCKK